MKNLHKPATMPYNWKMFSRANKTMKKSQWKATSGNGDKGKTTCYKNAIITISTWRAPSNFNCLQHVDFLWIYTCRKRRRKQRDVMWTCSTLQSLLIFSTKKFLLQGVTCDNFMRLAIFKIEQFISKKKRHKMYKSIMMTLKLCKQVFIILQTCSLVFFIIVVFSHHLQQEKFLRRSKIMRKRI